MSQHAKDQIDRIQGPENGVLELFIHQHQDWESDPFLVKRLKEKITSYQEYLASAEFRQQYPNCHGNIVLETSKLPPEELHQLLAKEGVEIRIVSAAPAPAKKKTKKPKHKIDRIQKTEDNGIELFIDQHEDWESDPLLVKHLRGKIQAYQNFIASTAFAQRYPFQSGNIILETYTPPPEEIHDLLAKDDIEIRVVQAPQPETHKGQDTPSAPATKPSFSVADTSAPTASSTEESWESDAIDDEPMPVVAGGGSGPMLGLGAVALLAGIALAAYAIVALNPKPVPTTPTRIQPTSVSAKTTPSPSYVTVSLRPEFRTFIVIPVQDPTGNKSAIYALFAAKENRRLLLFAPKDQSDIIQRIEQKIIDPANPSHRSMKTIWKADVKTDKPKLRTYTGTLEKAQRRPQGPLEVVLPDENRNINKIYQRAGVEFPMDTMILLVGQTPKPAPTQQTLFLIMGILLALIGGGIALAARRGSKSAF